MNPLNKIPGAATDHTAPHFYDHMCGANLRCSLKFNSNHNRTAPYFCGHMCGTVFKMQFERFKVGIFFKFWAFLTQPKTIFPFTLGQVLSY